MEYNDDYMIAEIRAGGNRQEQAIKVLYEQHFHLARYSRQKYPALGQDDAVTAYNSAIIALRRQLLNGVFRGESSLTTYLNRIYSNKCVDLLRQKSSQRLESMETLPDRASDDDVLQRLVQSDQLQRAVAYLQTLGEVCKQILLDSEYWGYSSDEIAQRIGFSGANSVNSKKYSCLQKLRQLMGQVSS
ncbi:MAG: sigma-70 family RNA polymerase sigma factor [Saprospiraceae bacterium]|nr:sigma-70 family RNA polymerase sigma factor [Saprospiraceae bacterium]MCB0543961.1 sigma-70 family RNA polymerase sigma factor [Saprospiraceae bacterium]MCB0574133.1 sigma-70 family RNA polymerase sigma factor [Saprospiraceae bacterium]MCB9353119.1 sigma-70 family RNA polymerase sigma factor [Lewinellaceae bacterium]